MTALRKLKNVEQLGIKLEGLWNVRGVCIKAMGVTSTTATAIPITTPRAIFA
jgi:hypothetical protein